MELAVQAAELGNLNAISDAASAVNLASTAIDCAGLNILVNVKNLKDTTPAKEYLKGLKDYQHKAKKIEEKLEDILEKRAGLDLD
jgi:glutamate formiminotransferase/formiminotetrahydrofolate cyclodeaminase